MVKSDIFFTLQDSANRAKEAKFFAFTSIIWNQNGTETKSELGYTGYIDSIFRQLNVVICLVV